MRLIRRKTAETQTFGYPVSVRRRRRFGKFENFHLRCPESRYHSRAASLVRAARRCLRNVLNLP